MSDITLRKHSKTVEFETVVNNTARDHRLRVEFPAYIDGDDCYSSQAFTFVTRKRGVTKKIRK